MIKPPNIHWRSGGLSLFYMLGITRNLMATRPEICGSNSKFHYSGISAGAWCAYIAGSDIDPTRLDISVNSFIDCYTEDNFWGNVDSDTIFNLLDIQDFSRDKTRIGLTDFPSMKRSWATDFNNNQDIIEACMASSHVPLLCGTPTYTYKKNNYMDGAIGIGPRRPPDVNTVLTISPTVFGRKYSKKEGFVFDKRRLKKLYRQGKNDSLRYSKIFWNFNT